MNPFAWGVASASYQTEDPVIDPKDPAYFEVDWDVFHKAGRLREPRGMATYSWSEMERDIAVVKSLNVTHYRFGIEWARIEPQPGVHNDEALQKYVWLAKRLKEEGITPVVCLWHFNFPSWLTDVKDGSKHGWHHPLMEKHWKAYVTRVLKAFANEVQMWMPQNEPNAYPFVGYLIGWFPPGHRADFKGFREFMRVGAHFYNQAADLIHDANPANKVITVQNIVYWKKSIFDITGYFWQVAMDYNYLHLDLVHQKSDIIGFNYYFKLSAFLIPGPRTVKPEGMRHSIDELYRRYRKPMMITENGLQEKKDVRRRQYMQDHVDQVLTARRDGLPVEGYFYWCLADNFEWCMGYREYYGLHKMDPATRKLIPKQSAGYFADLVKSNLSGHQGETK